MRSSHRANSDGFNIGDAATGGSAGVPSPYLQGRPNSPASAIQTLLEGNRRWSEGRAVHPGVDFARREYVARAGQKPFAAILSCADSRVPPELLFDEGVGDLFVVRVAGNSIEPVVEQSLVYAVEHLGVETIMLLGHQGCGAVKGALEAYPGAAPEFLSLIYSAIEKARGIVAEKRGNSDNKDALNAETVNQHILLGVSRLCGSHPIRHSIDAGRLSVVGGRYDLDSGRVTVLTQ